MEPSSLTPVHPIRTPPNTTNRNSVAHLYQCASKENALLFRYNNLPPHICASVWQHSLEPSSLTPAHPIRRPQKTRKTIVASRRSERKVSIYNFYILSLFFSWKKSAWGRFQVGFCHDPRIGISSLVYTLYFLLKDYKMPWNTRYRTVTYRSQKRREKRSLYTFDPLSSRKNVRG